ncbi:hypothetical protein [Amycolatopsis benzoatilytica]|uniref:hypothetical protein n=1 Tax=Amycolatopsis benzoatilytica TaxID=346045 RepID=UPI0005596B70|nr:hypothetical protein [Amycolatopsis benzoatilytica]
MTTPPTLMPAGQAAGAVLRSLPVTIGLMARRRIRLPRDNVGLRIRFADGTEAPVFRETVITRPPPPEPCILVVAFELRVVRGRGHALFRRESLLNTVLFAGFPGLVSKLWLADDEQGRYRGLYEWDGAASAEAYARALWRVLALVSRPDSIGYHLVPGLDRLALFDGCRREDRAEHQSGWWLPTQVDPPAR